MDRNGADAYEDASDLPVDYSKKYMERNALQNRQNHHLADSLQSDGRPNKKEYRECEAKVDLFGDYAETDLDQPTDYSLRYAEDDTDEDEKQGREYFPGGMQEEDTVKTYCTEGTPYETPFNFSTATSMSDLRVEDLKESDLVKKPQKKVVSDGQKEPAAFKQKPVQRCDERQAPITKKLENAKCSSNVNCSTEQPVSQKTINYYEGGTPGSFSRVNSLSSLSSAITTPNANNVAERIAKVTLSDAPIKIDTERNDRNVLRLNSNESTVASESNSPSDGKNNTRVVDKEGKMVTFCGQDYYAEQTPLMFSRCSSLGSLSGFEQHSIHDDRSSIVSDFSRRTSGIVSPSELPDSPTQTVPPSPRNQKTQATDFAPKMPEEAVRPPVRRLLYVKPQATKNSVFEDDIATFKEESTPIEFSSATSLSSLTIDDEVKISDFSKNQKTPHEVREDEHQTAPKSALSVKVNVVDGEKEQEQVSDGDEDDDDMLAACISMGMQNNRYRRSFKTPNIQKSAPAESADIQYQRNAALNRLEPHINALPVEAPATSLKTTKTAADVVPDTVHVYCTEDTPADISPVGSQSNLSALSMPSVQEDVEKTERTKEATSIECHRNDLSDESSNLSGEDEKILDECIQSGMPKVQQITPPPAACIHFAKKTEALAQKFNICGTPSSSPVECGHNNKPAILNKPPCRKLIEHENVLSDDSPNHSEDEAILSECIQSAMPKVRLRMSPSLRSPSLRSVAPPAVTAIRKSPSAYLPFRRQYPERQPEMPKKKPVHVEDNFSLSEEEEDIILAQCIQSGMPKALNVSSTVSASVLCKTEKCIKAVNIPSVRTSEHSEFVSFPARSSVESEVSHRLAGSGSSGSNRFPSKSTASRSSGHTSKNYESGSFNKTNVAASRARRTQSLPDNRNHGEAFMTPGLPRVTKCRSPSFVIGEDDEDESCRVVNKSALGPSRQSSVSSLSEEGSLGSIEEWALLEFCITPGMPKHHRYRVQGMKPSENAISHNHDDCDVIPEDNYSVCSYNSYVCKT